MKALYLIAELKPRYPELRLIQFIYFALSKAGVNNNDIYYVTDKDLIRGLEILKGEENGKSC